MTTVAPKKITLTCTVTGKTVTWTNQKIIQAKIDKYGSLEAFQAQYTSKGANKKEKVRARFIKPVLEQGIRLGKMTNDEYRTEYVTRVYPCNDGTVCTVTAPKPPTAKLAVWF